MKKRLLSLLMAVLMLVSLVPAVYADGDTTATTDTCEHKNATTITVKKDADNKTPGVEYKFCGDCGEIFGTLTIKPFVSLSWNQCKTCEKGATMVVKEATCDEQGLIVSYCEKCGKEFANKDFANASYKIVEELGHVWDEFFVLQQPTCSVPGNGYAVCKVCGTPEYVAGEEEAVALLDFADFDDDYAKFAARVAEVNAMFAPVDPGHTKLVAVTKETKLFDNDGNPVMEAGEQVVLKPAVKATHAKQISDGTEPVYPYGDGSGYTGDKVCPYCGIYEEGAVIPSLNVTHKNYKTTEAGTMPKYDDGEQLPGLTDAAECADCRWSDNGTTVSFTTVYKPENVVGEKYVVNEVTASCTAEGYTGDTYVYQAKKDTDGKVVLDDLGFTVVEPVLVSRGTVVPALGHKMALAEGKAPTCFETGYTYVDYKACTREGCDYHEGNPANTITVPTLKHKDVTTVVVEATCTHGGLAYTACQYCEWYNLGKDDNGDAMYAQNAFDEAVVTTDKIDHVAADTLKDAKEATCKEVGYTGDKVCKNCGEVIEKGEEIPLGDHKTELKDAKDATCAAVGYTGDEVCTVCGETVKKGTEIAKGQHKTELKNVKEATCTAAGYSGDEVCTVCGETVKKGEETALAAHKFANGVCTVCGAKDTTVNPFKDVNATTHKDYYDAILWGYYNGVVKGTNSAQTLFSPEASCTRAQIVTFLYRAENASPVTGVANPFTDVSATADKDYYDAIMWAVKNGIVEGTSATTFDPYATCTRAQIVTMLYRLEGEPAVTNKTVFTDLTADWYLNSVNWAFNLGITLGNGDGTFSPDAPCTRAQTITFIYRYYNT